MGIKKPTSVQTMTSREVVAVINSLRPEGKAELRHDDFCRKLLKLKEELSLRNISESDYKSERGKVYTEYLLDKETCLLMVAWRIKWMSFWEYLAFVDTSTLT